MKKILRKRKRKKEKHEVKVEKEEKKKTRLDTRPIPVADGWAGAIMQKPLGIQKCDGRTDQPTYRPTNLPTDRHGKV